MAPLFRWFGSLRGLFLCVSDDRGSVVLRNFSTLVRDEEETYPTYTTTIKIPRIVERVTVISDGRAYLGKQPQNWTWQDFRDYVTYEIEQRFGPWERSVVKEASIFKSFFTRWGPENAVAIARHAFDHFNGMWGNARVSVYRFCKGSDQSFAQPIAQRLELKIIG